ncbi:hypothetical protein AAFG13_08175 [Bradyrhizobium sp. B124]|uniref:DUF6894 family protein n=1 Tax=Bradyrhizobium sp. B124 TaxID=3140245 RepID=UPI003182E18F
MRTYYFDTKDGVPVRDRIGLEFANVAAAITHSNVVVIDESGEEITGRRSILPENRTGA